MPVSRLLPGDPERIDGYLLAGRLGEGGQGIVYEGYDASGARAAVKVLYRGNAHRGRFGKEPAAATRVASFCTARVLAADLDGPTPYIVSEYVDGPSLRRFVAENGPLTGDGLHRLAVAVATALVAIHEAGVSHRDLKPDNVLLGPDGPRVIGFGIARTEEMTRTSTGPILGTTAYLAPEVLRGERGGRPADVFAWGAVVMFAATGHSPFEGPSLGAIMHRVLAVDPELPDLPGPLRGLVAAALDKDPAARPPAPELLLRLLGGGGGRRRLLEEGAQAADRLLVERSGRPALGALAEEVYGGLDAAAQAAAPGLLLRLVTPGEGGTDAPRAAPYDELAGLPGAEPALHAFTEAGLLARDRSGVRLAHPALLYAWPRLRDWIEAGRSGLTTHRRLGDAALNRRTHGFRPGDLYQGSHLEQARDRAATGRRYIRPTEVETRFPDAAAANARKSAWRRRAVATAMGVLLVVALVAVAAAVYAARTADERSREAQRQTELAVSRRLAAQSSLAGDDPALSAMPAVAAWRAAPADEARVSMPSAVASRNRGVVARTAGEVPAVAFDPGGTVIASGASRAGTRPSGDLPGGDRVIRHTRGHSGH